MKVGDLGTLSPRGINGCRRGRDSLQEGQRDREGRWPHWAEVLEACTRSLRSGRCPTPFSPREEPLKTREQRSSRIQAVVFKCLASV